MSVDFHFKPVGVKLQPSRKYAPLDDYREEANVNRLERRIERGLPFKDRANNNTRLRKSFKKAKEDHFFEEQVSKTLKNLIDEENKRKALQVAEENLTRKVIEEAEKNIATSSDKDVASKALKRLFTYAERQSLNNDFLDYDIAKIRSCVLMQKKYLDHLKNNQNLHISVKLEIVESRVFLTREDRESVLELQQEIKEDMEEEMEEDSMEEDSMEEDMELNSAKLKLLGDLLLKHDENLSGFLKYAVEKSPKDVWDLFFSEDYQGYMQPIILKEICDELEDAWSPLIESAAKTPFVFNRNLTAGDEESIRHRREELSYMLDHPSEKAKNQLLTASVNYVNTILVDFVDISGIYSGTTNFTLANLPGHEYNNFLPYISELIDEMQSTK